MYDFDDFLQESKNNLPIKDENFAEKYLKNELNDAQYKAVIDTDNNCLVLAGAWSWKTKVLTSKITNIVFWKGVPVGHIFAVTFTNKAAKEIKERLLSLQVKVGWNITANELKWIWTFHSLFMKILKDEIKKLDFYSYWDSVYKKNFSIYDSNDVKSIIKKIIKEEGFEDVLDYKEVISFISKVKNLGILPDNENFNFENEEGNFKNTIGNRDIFNCYKKVYAKYQLTLLSSNAFDFDDLLLFPYLIFKKHPDVLKHYQKYFNYILVDEAQDTNWIQFELLRLLTKDWGNFITFVGDDYQSIYGWRGARMSNFLNIPSLWHNVKTYKLEINYRSRRYIVDAGQAVINKNETQFKKSMKSFKETEDNEKEKIKVLDCANSYIEAKQIVDVIKAIKEKKNCKWSDFAILYRINAISQNFEQLLLEQGIPYIVYGWYKFFDREEIKDIMSYIKFFQNEKDNISLTRMINTPWRWIGKTTLNKIIELSQNKGIDVSTILNNIEMFAKEVKINKSTITKIKDFLSSMNRLKEILNQLTVEGFIQYLITYIKYQEFLESKYDYDTVEDKIANLSQLVNVASNIDKTKIWMEAIEDFLNHVSLISDTDNTNTGDVVSLMTIHSSKGLEFENVFIVGVEQEIFPSIKNMLNKAKMEEERRLMYVAITRAKENLFISFSNVRMQWWQQTYSSESIFLEEIPNHLKKSYTIQ